MKFNGFITALSLAVVAAYFFPQEANLLPLMLYHFTQLLLISWFAERMNSDAYENSK